MHLISFFQIPVRFQVLIEARQVFLCASSMVSCNKTEAQCSNLIIQSFTI